ncbi:MAG: transglutaminase domain-containing protein, partial [Opitutaceae bacterium]
DSGIALSVDVSDESLVPASPYWRMVVLDKYEAGTFKLSGPLRVQEYAWEKTDTRLDGAAPSPDGGSAFWTFYLESGVSRHLPLLGRFHALTFRDVQTSRNAPRLGLVSLREEPVTMTAYRVEGFEPGAQIPDKAFAARWRSQPRRRDDVRASVAVSDTDRGELDRVVAELVRDEQIAAPEFIQRANLWLKQRHAYSLNPVIPAGAGDPLVRWLRSRESGHCELFAGSLVLLARTAGFPARVVTGFRGGTWNGYSHNFTIRNADAHAWTEIFDETTGAWLRADPLAGEAGGPGVEMHGQAAVASRLDRSWKARFDSLRIFWYRRIVSFDQRSQVETVQAVKEAAQSSGLRLREMARGALAAAKQWIGGPWDTRRWAGMLVVVAALAGLFWGWREFGRAWWRSVRGARGNRQSDPVRSEAGRWLGRLADEPAQTDAIAQSRGELQRLRFGPPGRWPAPAPAFRRARHALREARRPAGVTRS